MKIKDYLHYTFLNFKINKFLYVIIGLIMVSILCLSGSLFLKLSMDISVSKTIESNSEIATLNVSLANEKKDSENIDVVHQELFDSIINLKGIEDYFTFSGISYYLPRGISDFYQKEKNCTVKIDDDTYILDDNLYKNSFNEGSLFSVDVDIIDKSKSTNIFVKTDYETCEKPLISGNGFSNDSVGEIMISSIICEKYGLNPNELINKEFTLSVQMLFDDNYDIKHDGIDLYDLERLNVISKFKIVGIYDYNIYKSQFRKTSFNYERTIPLFWITNDSVSDDSQFSSMILNADSTWDFEYKYSLSQMEDAGNSNKKILKLYGLGTKNYSTMAENNLKVQFKSYKDLWNSENEIYKFYINSTSYDGFLSVNINCYNSLYVEYAKFYPIYDYISSILFYGSIIVLLICSMVLINSFYHDIKKRSGFIGMTKAIGYKNKTINLMFLSDYLFIFGFGIICSFIIGSLTSIYGSSYLNKKIIEIQHGCEKIIDIKFSYIYFLLGFGIIVIFVVLLGILTYEMVKKKIKKIDIINMMNS